MIKILVADRDIQQNLNSLKNISLDKKLFIKETYTEDETYNSYIDINPDVLILSTFFNGLKTSLLVNKISDNINEKQKSNIVLTTNNSQELLNFDNISKVYRIILKPIVDTVLLETIQRIYIENNIKKLAENDIDVLFLELNINRNSNGGEFLAEAIKQCFYFPFLLKKFDTVLEKISIKYGVTKENVRSCIRNTLTSLNLRKNNLFAYPIYNHFDKSRNITPKYFLYTVVSYLNSKKQ